MSRPLANVSLLNCSPPFQASLSLSERGDSDTANGLVSFELVSVAAFLDSFKILLTSYMLVMLVLHRVFIGTVMR